MFGIEPSEYLLVAAVALVVIGPKDLPRAMAALGRWIAKGRRAAAHLRAGLDEAIRQAEAAGNGLPQLRAAATPAQALAVLLTPDTRSLEPGGTRSTVEPHRPGALARSFAPPPAADPESPGASPHALCEAVLPPPEVHDPAIEPDRPYERTVHAPPAGSTPMQHAPA